MIVRARFLALPPGILKDTSLEVDVPDGTTAGGLVTRLADQHPGLLSFTRFVSVAVNRTYVSLQAELHEGDEVIISPPVGGG
jgi:molybdopterin converting factor small subunit